MKERTNRRFVIFTLLLAACIVPAQISAQDNTYTGPVVRSSLDMEFYGKIKLDAAWDSHRTDVGNYARWVGTGQNNASDSQFNMTANETRLGLKIFGPDVRSTKTSGLVEIDFYGGSAENSPHPRMRHAYMKLEWPDQRSSLIVGQTWDVFSPLNPTTLNYSVQWWAGNIGYRRPQIRFTKIYTLSENSDLKVEGALARTIGDSSGFDPGDTGEDACFPAVQARASLSFPFSQGRETTVGVSGHFAREEYDTDVLGNHADVNSWSGNLDVTMPINDWLTVKAEGFAGQNIDAYLGGIGQGIEVVGTTVTELDSYGGWCAASLGPWDNWSFNVGISGEFITNNGLVTASTRTSNTSYWANVIYAINKHASVGFELGNWHTKYLAQAEGNSLRAQASFIYKF